jgi:LDH2 family malate/lactate/ureidoglycolate dehydrogenase
LLKTFEFIVKRWSLWMSSSRPYISVDRLRGFITRCLEKLDLPAEDAATCGRLMTDAEVQGSDGHGVIRLIPYARRCIAG